MTIRLSELALERRLATKKQSTSGEALTCPSAEPLSGRDHSHHLLALGTQVVDKETIYVDNKSNIG